MKHLYILLAIFASCASCVSYEREDYYVDRLNMCVSIKNIESDSTSFSPIYRIYLNKPDSLTNRDYIEISYVKSEMPSITLHFPLTDPHSVYILDYGNEVRKWQSDIYKFQTISNSDSIDSLVHRTPCNCTIGSSCLCWMERPNFLM